MKQCKNTYYYDEYKQDYFRILKVTKKEFPYFIKYLNKTVEPSNSVNDSYLKDLAKIGKGYTLDKIPERLKVIELKKELTEKRRDRYNLIKCSRDYVDSHVGLMEQYQEEISSIKQQITLNHGTYRKSKYD